MSIQPTEPGSLLLLDMLEELDFPIECQHSQHHEDNPELHHDDGVAKWICKAIHCCPGNGPGPTYYPACDAWAGYVRSMQGRLWVCGRCGYMDAADVLCVVVGPLT